jgi:uncharacterized protein (TIGR02569 family)
MTGMAGMAGPPPPSVLAAFGARGEPTPIEGGQGTSWRAGDLVLKPVDAAEEVLEWHAALLEDLVLDDVRVARPRRTRDGALLHDGWSAAEHMEGAHEPGRWQEVIAAGRRLHRGLAGVGRPAIQERRTDPWAVADRVAWGEHPADLYAHVEHVGELAAARRRVSGAGQLVHGDLTGNVLFADGLSPAVIDLSLYWRPPAFASAVVVVDALVWHGADEGLVDALAEDVDDADVGQFLIRALIFRLVAEEGADPGRSRFSDGRGATAAPSGSRSTGSPRAEAPAIRSGRRSSDRVPAQGA